MRTREEQIKPWGYISPFATKSLQDREMCNLTITGNPTVSSNMPLYTDDQLLEAERCAEQRVRAEIGRLQEENEALQELAKAGRDYLKYCSAVVKGGAA